MGDMSTEPINGIISSERFPARGFRRSKTDEFFEKRGSEGIGQNQGATVGKKSRYIENVGIRFF